jgi:hypothetical protein
MIDEMTLERYASTMNDSRIIVRAPTGRTVPAAALFFAGTLLAGASGTTFASSLDVYRLTGSPSSSLVAVRDQDDVVSLADLMAEIKRRSGLTWEELGGIFSVSRKTVHNWASGAAIKEVHLEKVRQLLDRVRALGDMRPFQLRRLLLEDAGVADRVAVRATDAGPILFADQTPSDARVKVRKGGMKIVRRNGANG